MAERIIPMRSTERENEIVRHIWLKSSTARSRSQAAYYIIRVGVAQGADVEWLGAWDQSKYAIATNSKYSLSGEFPLNIPLYEGDEFVVGIRTFGAPLSLDGMSIEIKGGRTGGVSDQVVRRTDGDFPPGSEVAAPLFAANANVTDGPTRDAINGIVDTLNDSGALDWSHSHALSDTDSGNTVVAPGVLMDRDSTGATYTSTSFADGAVSVDVPVSAGKTVDVLLVAAWSYEGASAAVGVAECAIGDGTTDYNEVQQYTTGTGDNRAGSTTLAQSITTATTYKLRVKKVSGSNPLIEDQTLTALYVQKDT